MMLQRTKADQVERVYRDFFTKFKKPSDAAKASTRIFRSTLLPLGLHWRIVNFRAVARVLAATPGERVPRTRQELRLLPGVGDYVAGAVSSVAFNQCECCSRVSPLLWNLDEQGGAKGSPRDRDGNNVQ